VSGYGFNSHANYVAGHGAKERTREPPHFSRLTSASAAGRLALQLQIFADVDQQGSPPKM
jgi:hypothetical protein